MASTRDNARFLGELIVSYPLDVAIEWIERNLNPEDVFDESRLEDWAKENGFEEK